VYVADTGNSRIQQLDASGAYVSQFPMRMPGETSSGMPSGIAVDQVGNVYASDLARHRVIKFNSSGAPLAQWGQLGSAPGELSSPFEVDVGADGNVYVADFGNDRVQVFDTGGKFLEAVGSTGNANGQFSGPTGASAALESHLYVADRGNNRVQRFFAPSSPPPPDTTPPELTDLHVSLIKHKRGGWITYELSEDATVTFTITTRRLGFGRECERSNKKAWRGRNGKHHHRGPWFCVLFSPAGSFTAEGTEGPNRHFFPGTVGGERLRPGVYRLTAIATDAAGNESKPASDWLIVVGHG
jgi:hypothetical protein